MKFWLLRLRIQKLWFSMRHPQCWPALIRGIAPAVEHHSVLRGLDVDSIIDVGANRGQFSLLARILWPNLPIIAYEPLPRETEYFLSIHRADPNVILHNCALGDSCSTAKLHVTASSDSSSLLPIGQTQVDIFSSAREVGQIEVSVKTLDSFFREQKSYSKSLLKIDVQGYELNVLRGASEALKCCRYVFVECSEVALYQGQALQQDVSAFLVSNGFVLITRSNELYVDGKLVQADYLYKRTC